MGMKPFTTGDATAATLPDGKPNPAGPDNWVVGSPAKPLDLLLIFAHDENIAEEARPIIGQVSSVLGSAPNYRNLPSCCRGASSISDSRDGVSQVGVRGRIIQNGEERPITTRYGVPSRNGIDFGKPGQPLVWPGQFLTGQPRFEADDLALAPEFTNGSFLVFRRLRQDVKTFYGDTVVLARKLSADTERLINEEELRARIVGRFRSGAALMRHDQDAGKAEGPEEINYFAYGIELPPISLDDGIQVSGSPADSNVLRGQRCPIWSHIRKVNPRDLPTDRGGPSETLAFQMLRRGIPFGPLYDHDHPDAPENKKDRGLALPFLQRSIDDQFGSLNRGWMNNPSAPSAGKLTFLSVRTFPTTAAYMRRSRLCFSGLRTKMAPRSRRRTSG